MSSFYVLITEKRYKTHDFCRFNTVGMRFSGVGETTGNIQLYGMGLPEGIHGD
jgi:hypothetical protein